jgi:hypothetical protein
MNWLFQLNATNPVAQAMGLIASGCILLGAVFVASRASAQTNPNPAATNAPSKFRSPDDGRLDSSGFLDEKYGFLPVVLPITKPAVGYGAAGGLAFISKPLSETRAGFGRPNISLVGGLGTANGSWGALAGDVRHWLDDHLQTLTSIVYASVNLDFHGIGEDSLLAWNDFERLDSMQTVVTAVPAFDTNWPANTGFTSGWTWRSVPTTRRYMSKSAAPGHGPDMPGIMETRV